ncbi:MAG: RNA-binding protein [Candidatus Handelsmanbacteria bacterium]|nr:RNA-binding protein [Candidatus Handelsmanbacteria bacterium]
MDIYVGNLSYRATEEELRRAFEAFGRVDGLQIIKDKLSGQSRGFAFVQMPQQSEAEAAIAGMHGREFGGRTLTVNQAKPRQPRSGRP